MEKLWNTEIEQRFFNEAQKFATLEQLFYVTDSGKHVAYWPKSYDGTKSTLQSRNALIGNFTEKWTTDLIQGVVKDKGLFAVQGAICNEIALSNMSPADVVIPKNSYYSKVDHLKVAGIIQGFWSVNPKPLDNDGENIKKTKKTRVS